MTDVPIQLLVAAFEGEREAEEVLKGLKAARKKRVIGIQDAAVLRRDQKGKLHIKETGDWGGGKGAAAGAAVGVTVGILTGGAGLLLGAAAAAIGGLAAKLRDSGFSDARLEADVFTAAIADDIAAQLEAGREVAYTALGGQEGIAMGRLSVGEEDIEAGAVVIAA
jgi:uncharacterized membrane protein